MLNPLRDTQDERPVSYCGRCWGEVFSGETMVFYEGEWLCPDCFRATIDKILGESIPSLAAELQLDVISF